MPEHRFQNPAPYQGHMGMNLHLNRPGNASGWLPEWGPDPKAVPLVEAEIPRPAETYLVFDSGAYSINWWGASHTVKPSAFGYIPGYSKNSTVTWNNTVRADALAPRHSEGMNVGFVDGHVKWMRVDPMVNNRVAWVPAAQQSQ